uniref:Uncharacterized protein n=1 Tax=Pseudomonas phage HRDY3 TaxID=3236930 RepID=A0AB39CDL7_9VIRU
MGCEYGPSSRFMVVPSDVPNSGKRPETPVPEINEVGESACVTGLKSLAYRLEQDVRIAKIRTKYGFEMPQFILLAHQHEFEHPDLAILRQLYQYIEFRDITIGYPLSINAYLYITDPAAYGLPKGLTEEEVLNSFLRNSVRITYIVKNTDLE